MSLSFSQIQQAWRVQDPRLVDKLYVLATQQDEVIHAPIPEHELTFERFLDKVLSHQFRQQHPEVQFAERVSMLATLEADDGVHPLPDRYKLHIILIALWDDGSTYSRAILKQAIDRLPLSYGVWRGVKHIYKQAEVAQDYEMFGRIAAKIDVHRFDQKARSAVSIATKTYMSLRAWRYLRRLGQQMPICYIDAAVHVLASYDDTLRTGSPEQKNSWVLNHICFHNSLDYGVNRFSCGDAKKLFNTKGRAFNAAWLRDAEPLLTLLATAKSEAVRQFATDSMKHDFKTQLREVSCNTIQYLSAGQAHSQARDEMIVWLLETSPNFEKSQFRALGLHQVVITLLRADFVAAYQYAIGYAKSYAQDLPITELMGLAISDHAPVRAFAINTLLSRDPIAEVGIKGWGQLLDTKHHHKTAIEQLSRHFTRRDLTPAWFFARLTSGKRHSVHFAIKKLPELYSAKELGVDYFIQVAQQLDIPDNSEVSDSHFANDEYCMDFVLSELRRLNLSQVNTSVWQMLLLHPFAKRTIMDWIEEGILAAGALDMAYWHALAHEPDWQSSDYIQAISSKPIHALTNVPISDLVNSDELSIGQEDMTAVKNWQKCLAFDEDLADDVRLWLADVRRFTAAKLGFDWLMRLAHSEQAMYREFAISRINKGFLPADFVAYFDSSQDQSASADGEATAKRQTDTKTEVDLSGQRYLFTGKMQSMTRGEAEKVVKAANGAISSAVNAKLDYLVIGDDGSPLYGNGRKGSKQIKAEDLIAAGAALKIISETAFLQMLSGQSRTVSDDDTQAGAQALWRMATADADAPISELAISYLSHHHEQICMALTDRPVDPDAIIPSAFFSAERIIPLLTHRHNRLRGFGLLVSEYEMASWQPTPALWLTMAESPFYEVTQFLKRALLDNPCAANQRYHISACQLSKVMLNAFINSKKSMVRQIGIALLQRHPKFQNVQSLYQLTQSTDREVRYAAVTMLWQHYKARHISPNWQPFVSNEAQDIPTTKGSTNAQTDDITAPLLQTAKRLSDDMPADIEQLLLLLRRGLFELPPGRLGGAQDLHTQDKNSHHKGADNKPDTTNKPDTLRLKPIAASQAKLALIETFRDVGLSDRHFAALILPTLFTFTQSAGKMERHACLVAVTRLLHRYPELSAALQPVASA